MVAWWASRTCRCGSWSLDNGLKSVSCAEAKMDGKIESKEPGGGTFVGGSVCSFELRFSVSKIIPSLSFSINIPNTIAVALASPSARCLLDNGTAKEAQSLPKL